MIRAPISVRRTLPTPPVIALPPTITAAIAGSSSSMASVGEPPVEAAGEDHPGEARERA
jgi:hypothetical protein